MNIALRNLHDRLASEGLVLRTQGPVRTAFIDRLANDSRKVGPKGLFVAVRGEQTDGHLFIDKAVKKGAIAIVCEAMPENVRKRYSGIAFIQVSNARAALAELAASFYGDPSRELVLMGVTGTNGKTTTAYLVHHLLSRLAGPSGLISTVEYRIGEAIEASTHTTPDVLDTSAMMRRMIDADCVACSMEVSSHALAQDRARALDFDAAVYTNLTRDHLDYHGTFDAYLSAKKRLFDELDPGAAALYNLDDPAGPAMVADTPARVFSYGQHEAADFRVAVLANNVDGLRLSIDGKARAFNRVGLFNAYNLTAAYGVGRALGYEADAVLDALTDAPPVPGRFEQLRFGDGTSVIVDYAHTPDALENVLQTAQALKPVTAVLWCVFGCGGDRDPSKRRIMGSLAERYADRVIVTSDNPRTEDPAAILNDIRRGMDRPGEALWLVDRRAAIREAARLAAPGDVVLIAGKGHETYQVLGTRTVPFDDRDEARAAFGDRGPAPA